MKENNEKNSTQNLVEFGNIEITHSNFPLALAWLIQEFGNLKSLLLASQKPVVELNDRIGLEEACKVTGYSRSKVYKLTYSNSIPHRLLGNRLIFSRIELLSWLEENTRVRPPKSKAVLTAISQSAAKKERASR